MTTDINRRVLPGFGLSLGYTLLYMSLVVAIPMAAGFLKASSLSFDAFWAAVASDRAVAAYNSPGYKKALAALGKDSCDRDIRILEGVE